MNESTMIKVREFIIEFQKENGISPSFRAIMHKLKLGSLATVQRYVIALEQAGEIRRTNNGNIDVIPQLKLGTSTIVPLIGDIACGSPSFALENIVESFALPISLFGSRDLFLLKACGDSMIDVGINSGDILVLRKQNSAPDGSIVVALIDDEATLKRIYHRKNQIILHPENKLMEDIIVDDCIIQGVLVSCIKMF